MLDRLIKDIVTESEKFEIESFIPLLQKHIRKPKPYIRQLIVSWISVLHNVPDINMLDYLPEFLEGLFNMISDTNREIEQAAANALGQFLRDIKETAEVVEFAPIVTILIQEARQPNRDIRYTAMVWIQDFITLGGTKLVSLYSGMLSSVMYNISDLDPNIRDKTVSVNVKLMELMRATTESFNLSPILLTLTAELSSEHVESRKAALDWIRMLHDKEPKELNKHISELLPALLKAISDEDADVVSASLELKAKIARDKTQFNTVLEALINLFYENRPLLELKGALVIRKLSSMLEPQEIYISLATILNDHPDYDFVSLMVQTLNLILLTAPELSPLRKSLKTSGSAASCALHKDVFESLFKCWCHNPVSTFSLCLLAQAYDLSAKLVSKFAEVEITIGFLMQIDKLVQLLESPIFTQLRLQLLEVNSEHHADLVKSLYGLLMLLPQSQAYKTLSDRLSTASSLHMHIGFAQTYAQATPIGAVVSASGGGGGSFLTKSSMPPSPKKDSGKQNAFGKDSLLIDYDKLLKHFDTAQSRHYAFRQLVLREKNFTGDSKAQLSSVLVNGTTL